MGFSVLLRHRAAETPDAPFLIDAGTGVETSYAAAWEQARRWAAFFARQPGRVAVALPNSVDFALMFLGALAAGTTLCPYNPALTDAEVAALAERFGAGLLVTTPDRAAGWAHGLPVVTLGARGSLPRELPAAVEPAPVADTTLAVLIMTSGTTGGVKACRLSQRSLLATAAATARAFGLDATSRYLTPLPLFHINAQVVGVLAALTAGGAVALGARLPAAKLFEAAARVGATGLSTVPALLHDLVEGVATPPASLRFVVTSSAPLATALRERFEQRFGLPLYPCYGLSEAGCLVAYGAPGTPMGASGRPVGCEVMIGPEQEVLVRGPGLFEGYDGDPRASAVAVREGWLHTGDRGRLEDGWLFIEGRLKDMINRGGEKLAPDAIEDAIRRHPAVAACAVFAIPDERLGEEVACALVLREPLDDDALWEHCGEWLAEFETPKVWLRLDELPRGATGKVLRRELRRRWLEQGPIFS